MEYFDDDETLLLIAVRRKIKLCGSACFLVAFILAITSAALAVYSGHFSTETICTLCVSLLFVAVLIGLIAAYAVKAGKFKRLIRTKIAAEALKCRAIFEGDEVELEVTLENDIMRILRKGFRGDVAFNLSRLKADTAAYSSFGSEILEFFEGYYSVNTAKGNVSIKDSIGAKPQIIHIVKGGKPVNSARNNLYVKGELI